jgi:RNA polymerase sigma-70 factor (ECF subfamily)
VGSDEALFDALARGDMRAFDRLYDRHARALFTFIRAQLRDGAEAEDVLHETFMAVLRQRDSRTEVRSFRAWIHQVARNLCLNRIRARERAGRAHEAAIQLEALGSAPIPAERALEIAEVTGRLASAVSRLPPPLEEVYRLRAAGLSYDDVAATLGIAVGTVKSRMHEMVSRLREEMRR